MDHTVLVHGGQKLLVLDGDYGLEESVRLDGFYSAMTAGARGVVATVAEPGGDICVFRFPRFAEEYGELRSRVDVFSPEFRLIGSTQTRVAEPEDVLNAPLLTVVNPKTRTVQGAISAGDLSSAARGPGE